MSILGINDVQLYDYELPKQLIAHQPISPRDGSRMLVVHRKMGRWEHRKFTDLPEYLGSKDLVVANNSRVLKARLRGWRQREEKGNWIRGGKIEFVLLEQIRPKVWEGLFHASAQYLPGLRFEIPTLSGKPLQGVLIRGSAESSGGTVVAEFDRDPVESDVGELPLPHYIQRPATLPACSSITSVDESSYQTVYAKSLGSAAAPTAGLHFTDSVLNLLHARGVQWEEITLHIGLGTFRPVKTKDIRDHVMHEERFEISPDVATRLTQWKQQEGGGRILGVGTTSVRSLESAWVPSSEGGGKIRFGAQKTSLFIHPGAFDFLVIDRMLTNFHLPKSTLLMLVCAFAGRDLILEAYHDAVREKYRFYSYGDAMLIL